MDEKNEKLKNYETTIRQRVECEEKAFHVVNKLIDGRVDDDYLIECGQLISREHYNDIVEERAISYLCGYPLCDNSLENIPKKKYHISTRSNKVYDISERKNFCSNQCLKASKHFCNQIPESPVWARARMPSANIKLLPHRNIKGIVGDEVMGASPKRLLEEEIMKLQDLDRKTVSSKSSSKKSTDGLDAKASDTVGNLARKEITEHGKDGEKLIQSIEKPAGHTMMKRGEELQQAEAAESVNNDLKGTASEQSPLDKELNKLSILDEDSQSCECGSNVSFDKMASQNISACLVESSLNQDLERLRISGDGAEEEDTIKNSKPSSYDKSHNKGFQEQPRLAAESSNLSVSSKSSPKTNKSSQMNHLLELLSKRKNLLSGMADIQTPVSEDELKGGKVKGAESNLEKSLIHETDSTVKDIAGGYSDTKKDTILARSPENTNFVSKPEKKKKLNNRNDQKPKLPLEHIANTLKTWVTDKTISYLQKSSSASPQNQHFSDPQIQRGYADLCKRLDVQQKEFENVISETVDGEINDSDEKKKRLKSIPDYKALKEESETFQLKVTEFITGKRPKDAVILKKQNTDEEDAVLLPTVDAHDQLQIRIKIVLDRLDKSIPDLLGPLSLSLQDVSTLIRELVYTFRLEKDNIVFKPSEWTLVSIFILKMLSEKNGTIAEAFVKESAVRYFTIVLKSLGHSPEDLNSLTEDILTVA